MRSNQNNVRDGRREQEDGLKCKHILPNTERTEFSKRKIPLTEESRLIFLSPNVPRYWWMVQSFLSPFNVHGCVRRGREAFLILPSSPLWTHNGFLVVFDLFIFNAIRYIKLFSPSIPSKPLRDEEGRKQKKNKRQKKQQIWESDGGQRGRMRDEQLLFRVFIFLIKKSEWEIT